MPKAMWWVLIAFQLATSEVFCFVNLVNGEGFNAVTAIGAHPQDTSWSADKAVDGNTTQDYESDSCAITDLEENKNTSIWWQVWLQRRFNIAHLEIYFRSDTYNRSTGFSIYTYNTQTFYPLRDPKHLVYHHDPLSGCPSPIMNVTVNSVIQGIVFINERPVGYTSNCPGDDLMYTGIELCEIKVMGCDQNRYTTECDRVCPYRCKNSHCDAFNGSCIHGCSNPEALTVDCIVCDDGMYVKNKTCLQCPGHCKNGAPCNKLTGSCENGCDPHWTGEFCQICENGYYGGSCENNCGDCLNGEPCDKRNGTCMKGCQSHFLYPLCKVCKDGFYGVNCSKKCGQCDENDICDKRTGYCLMVCKSNLQPPFCKADPSESERNREKSVNENNNIPEPAFYVAIGLLTALLLLSFGVIIYQRRRITGLLQNRHSTENTQTRSPTQLQNYDNITHSGEKHEYTSLDTVKQESHYNVI